jgi:hypothetical protein
MLNIVLGMHFKTVNLQICSQSSYTISVHFKDNTSCEIKGAVKTINPIPAQIQFESMGDCIGKGYIITASPLQVHMIPIMLVINGR